MSDYSFIANAHPSVVEALYTQYQQDPELVEAGWRLFFRGFDYGADAPANGNGHTANGAYAGGIIADVKAFKDEINVLALIRAYRQRGHLRSTTNQFARAATADPICCRLISAFLMPTWTALSRQV